MARVPLKLPLLLLVLALLLVQTAVAPKPPNPEGVCPKPKAGDEVGDGSEEASYTDDDAGQPQCDKCNCDEKNYEGLDCKACDYLEGRWKVSHKGGGMGRGGMGTSALGWRAHTPHWVWGGCGGTHWRGACPCPSTAMQLCCQSCLPGCLQLPDKSANVCPNGRDSEKENTEWCSSGPEAQTWEGCCARCKSVGAKLCSYWQHYTGLVNPGHPETHSVCWFYPAGT